MKHFTNLLIAAIIVFLSASVVYSQEVNIGINDTVYSDILKQKRAVSIYFPPSYYYRTNQEYPVLYILDGDYNFRYVAGLLELQAGIAENIPEMILVAISGQGSITYKKNCKPAVAGGKDNGNAAEMLDFIDKELIPFIDGKYKTLDYKILAGHSLGGLFIVNAAIEKPKLFDHYIAISPALQWDKNGMDKVVKEQYKNKEALGTDVYVSLADEKGMGVQEFLKLTGPEFKFKQFETENHNSVGAPTYEWALKDIFKVWKNEKLYFESADDLTAYKQENMATYQMLFAIPDGIWYNTAVYVLMDKPRELEKLSEIISADYPNSEAYFTSLLALIAIKNKEYEKAEEIVNQALEKHPDSFELHEKLADALLNQKKKEEALNEMKVALSLAREQKVRQWRIAEIEDLRTRVGTD